jgi:hypothetical protein
MEMESVQAIPVPGTVNFFLRLTRELGRRGGGGGGPRRLSCNQCCGSVIPGISFRSGSLDLGGQLITDLYRYPTWTFLWSLKCCEAPVVNHQSFFF